MMQEKCTQYFQASTPAFYKTLKSQEWHDSLDTFMSLASKTIFLIHKPAGILKANGTPLLPGGMLHLMDTKCGCGNSNNDYYYYYY
jgi:hypothetical protein